MDIKINKLIILNFVGIKEESFNFDGKDIKIYGNNVIGKIMIVIVL